MENYRVLRQLGEGAFGEVLLCENTRTRQRCAVKKVPVRRLDDGLSVGVWREFKAMQLGAHPRVVQIYEIFAHGSAIHLVMEPMARSLADVISARSSRFPEQVLKGYMAGILHGLGHLHSIGILHRDMKPSNVLIGLQGQVKLGDFGLARVLAKPEIGFSYQAATRWYRAPEMLFGARIYSPAVDMWGAGCIFAELMALSPLFPGETDIDQLHRIYCISGTPDVWIDGWPEAREMADFHKISFSPMPAGSLEALLTQYSRGAARLVAAMLRVPPSQRISALAALQDAWFTKTPFPAAPAHLKGSELATPGGRSSHTLSHLRSGSGAADAHCWHVDRNAWQEALAALSS